MSEEMLIRCKKAATSTDAESALASPTHLASPRVRDSQPVTTPPHLATTGTSIIIQNKEDESEQPEKPELPIQLERAKRFGHNLSQVKVGNRSAQQSTPAYPLAPKMIQCRLKIGQAGDKYEQEADRVAEQVMAIPAPPSPASVQRRGAGQDEPEALQTKPLAANISPLVQRQAESTEEQDEPETLQTKPLAANITPLIQRQAQHQDSEQEAETLQTKPLAANINSTAPHLATTGTSIIIQHKNDENEQHETLNLPTQLERAKRFSHNISQVSIGSRAAHRPTPAYPIHPKMIQCRLKIGQAGDKYEQEADRVAEQVMAMPASTIQPKIQRQTHDKEEQVQAKSSNSIPAALQLPDEEEEHQTQVDALAPAIQQQQASQEEEQVQTQPIANSITPLVQRQPTVEEELVPTKADPITSLIQQQEATEEEDQVQTKPLQLKSAPTKSKQDNWGLESRLTAQRGNGSPMSNEVRAFMEPRFGVDFSGVKIHTDSSAIQMNKELSAQAFTHGNNVYFGAGKYNPGTDGGKRLLAHELTHVVQQTGAVKLNKEVRRKPVQEQQDKQVLQAKEIGHSPEAKLNKQLHLQPSDKEEDKETLQAKHLSDRTSEVSPNKELRLQPLEDQPLQAKQLGDRAEDSSNKELPLQPLEEQDEQPLQAKQLGDRAVEDSSNKELQRQPVETTNPVIQAKALDGGFTSSPISIQRGIGDWVSNGWNKTKDVVGAGIERGRNFASGALNKGKDLLKSGLDWVKNNVIQPLMRLASSGWSAVKNFGSHISTAYKQANPTIWDAFQPAHLAFRVARNQRRQLFAQAIQAEQSQQAQATAGIQSSGSAPVQEPSQLERLNDLAEKVESVPAAGFNVGKELLEGAVVGDFNENPTIWNTIGQVAIGFVPYAGQAADIRDIIANVKKLHEGGYKDPDAWINLALTAIGIIPGVGDIIKAVGKGSKGVIRKALSGALKNADKVLRPALGKAKGMLNGARRYGKQFVGWASRQGARLRQGVTQFAQKTVNFAKAAGQRARGLVSALKSRIGGFVNSAMQKARAVASQGRGLMGKAIAQFMGMAQNAFNALQNRVSQAVNLVKAAAERTKDIVSKVGRKVADTTRKATTLLREFTQSAIQKGRQAVQKARQWSSQQVKKATDLGRRLVNKARDRVTSLVRQGVKLAKDKALAWIKEKIGGIKQRLLGFLKKRWNRLKDRLGIGKSEQPTGKTREPKGKTEEPNGKPVPEDLKKLVSDEAQLQRLLSKTGDDTEQLKQLLSAVGNDAAKLENLLDELGTATIKEIGAKGLKETSTHLTSTEIKDWVAKLGAKRVGELAEKYGGDAMKHYGVDWFQAYKGINLDTQRHVTVGDGHSKKSGISGCHDTDNFVIKYINPATDEQIFIHSQSISGAYTKYEYSMMKADGSGPKAQRYLKNTRKGLENNWISIAEDLTKQLDAAIKNKTFPINNGTKGSISYDGVTWEFWFRDGMIHSIYPII